ncbi:MAG: hypothetical protein LBU80_01655, partial [Rikenellaceae bacterium]|nr:hypothetical protein [Rikenellaceae bacterium]
MKKFISLTLVAALLALSTVSCVFDREFCKDPVNGNAATLLLRLQTPGDFAAPESRALTFEQENAITAVHVLVFDKTGTRVEIKQGGRINSGHTDPAYSGYVSFSVTLAASKTAADTYNLVV